METILLGNRGEQGNQKHDASELKTPEDPVMPTSSNTEIYHQDLNQVPTVNAKREKSLRFLAGSGERKHIEIQQSTLVLNRSALRETS